MPTSGEVSVTLAWQLKLFDFLTLAGSVNILLIIGAGSKIKVLNMLIQGVKVVVSGRGPPL